MTWQLAAWMLGIVALAIVVLRAMPFTKVVLWLPMRGRVLDDGVPVAGAVLVRECFWHWADKTITDRTTTQADGQFSFPPITARMLFGWVMWHEPVVEQFMTVEHAGVVHKVWGCFSHSYDRHGQFRGLPIDATCRLDADPVAHGDVFGRCEFH